MMEPQKKIKILIVEDHPLYRVGIHMSLSYSGLNAVVLSEAENRRQAVEYIVHHAEEIDLILLDYFLPDGNGLDVIRVSKNYCPNAKIILLSGEIHNPTVVKLTENEVDGYIGKDVSPAELKVRIEALFAYPNRVADNPLNNTKSKFDDILSEREIEIIRLCASGLTAQQIADKLKLSRRTVEAHKSNIFGKLDCKSTAELVQYAFRNGLID